MEVLYKLIMPVCGVCLYSYLNISSLNTGFGIYNVVDWLLGMLFVNSIL